MLLAAPSLNPVQFSVRSRTTLVAGSGHSTWGSGRGQIVILWGLDRSVVSTFYACLRIGGNVHSWLGDNTGSNVVVVPIEGGALDNEAERTFYR